MEGSNEYQRREIFLAPFFGWNVNELQGLGDAGWELTVIEPGESNSKRFLLLRLPAGNPPAPDSWEYHKFEPYGLPDAAWRNHLASCGWTLLEPLLIAYAVAPFYIAKRPGWYRGTDDGDILARLKDLGYELPYVPEERGQAVGEILEAKWVQSEKLGRNLGTYEAVRYWLAHRLIPDLLKRNGVPVPDRSPESFLDQLLALRVAYADGSYAPSLAQTVKRWRELNLK